MKNLNTYDSFRFNLYLFKVLLGINFVLFKHLLVAVQIYYAIPH